MYILIEGMPCTGKTTVSKRLAQMTGSMYLKSVLSNTKLGEMLKSLRNQDDKTLEYLYATDSILQELKTINLLKKGHGIIRDKSFLSSLAHISTHGYENYQQPYKNIVEELYVELCEESVMPDFVVLIEPDFARIDEYKKKKPDLSPIDLRLIDDPDMYRIQHGNLKNLLSHLYKDRLYLIKSFSMSVEESCRDILLKYKERRGKNEGRIN